MAGISCLVMFVKKRNIVFVLLTFLYNYCQGCSPPMDGVYEPPEMATKFHFSKYVVYGKVTAIYPGNYDYSTLYTTEIQVRCVFQGGPIPPMINITNSGFEPGLCRSNNYTVGGLYIAYMDDGAKKGVYTSSSGYHEDIADGQVIDDVPMICGVIVDYPIGLSELNTDWTCPDSYPDYEGCLEYVEKTDQPMKIDAPTTKIPVAEGPGRGGDQKTSDDSVVVAGLGGGDSGSVRTTLSAGAGLVACLLLLL